MYAFLLNRYGSLTTFDARCSKIMDAPTIQPKFLEKRNELGLVAVGFSGGQVSKLQILNEFTTDNVCSVNPASTQRRWL